MPPTATAVASDLGFNPGSGDSVAKFVGQQAAGKEAENAPIVARMQDDVGKDRAAVDVAKSKVEPFEVKEWKEKPPEANPIEAMGGLAQVFAGIAASFTHTPAINVMRTMAAGVRAFNEGNWENYQAAHQAWKENTELLFKRHQQQQADVQEALQTLSTDINLGAAMMKAVDTKYDDKIGLAMTLSGDWEKRAQLQISRDNSAQSMKESNVRLEALADERAKSMQRMDLGKKLMEAKGTGDPAKIQAAEQQLLAFEAGADKGALETQVYHRALSENAATRISVTADANDERERNHRRLEEIAADRTMSADQRAAAVLDENTRHHKADEEIAADNAKRRGAHENALGAVADARISDEEQRTGKPVQDSRKKEIYLSVRAEDKLAGSPWMQGTGAQKGEVMRRAIAADPTLLNDPARFGLLAKQVSGTDELTPGQITDIDNRSREIGQVVQRIERIHELIDKGTIALTTRLGRPLTAVESVENIIGATDSTDRNEFERIVDELRVLGPGYLRSKGALGLSKLNDPLVQKIIPGGNWKDTKQNVSKAYDDLENIMLDDLRALNGQYRANRHDDLPEWRRFTTGVDAAAPGSAPASASPLTDFSSHAIDTSPSAVPPPPAGPPPPAAGARPARPTGGGSAQASPRPVPPEFASDPDGTTYSGGKWVKRGNMLMPAASPRGPVM